MSDQPQATANVVVAPTRVRLSEWISILGLVAVVVGLVAAGGGYKQQVMDNTRRIEALETSDRERTATLATIDARTARIEGRLEVLLAKGGER